MRDSVCGSILLLASCARDVSIVGDVPDEPTTPVPEIPPDPVTDAPTVAESDQPCDLTAGSGFADDLPISWCQRVTPEPDQLYPPGDTVERCGFFNLTGDFGVVPSATPTVLYCDADYGGGLRLARREAGSDALTAGILASLDCAAWTGSGSLALLPSGELLGAWSIPDPAAEGYLVETARIGDEGTFSAGPFPHPESPDARKVAISLGAPPILFSIDFADLLWAQVILDDGDSLGPPLQLGVKIQAMTSATASGTSFVAACQGGGASRDELAGTVAVRVMGPDGTLESTIVVPGSVCGTWQQVGLAVLPSGTIALGWGSQSTHQFVAVLDPAGSVLTTTDLGPSPVGGAGPQLTTAGEGFLVASWSGEVALLDESGAPTVRFHHPTLVTHGIQLDQLYLWSDGESALFAPVWTDTLLMDPHVFTYDVIEVSVASLTRR